MSTFKDSNELWLFFLLQDCFCLICGNPKPSHWPTCHLCQDIESMEISFNGINPLGDSDGELIET